MAKKSQQEIFDNHIFKLFHDEDNYDKLKHQLNRARSIMMERHECFRNKSAYRQFEYCVSICIIAVQTSTKDLRQFRLSGDMNEVFKYALNEGYNKPNVIELDSAQKLLEYKK